MYNEAVKVYLAGEIHTNWRDEIKDEVKKRKLPILIEEPQTNHEKSDHCGEVILGAEESSFWHDHKAAKINLIRTRKAIEKSDLLIVRFGEKYRQWNAAFDVGVAATLGKSIISYHASSLDHALKEIDSVAHVVTRSVKEIVDVLEYVIIKS